METVAGENGTPESQCFFVFFLHFRKVVIFLFAQTTSPPPLTLVN